VSPALRDRSRGCTPAGTDGSRTRFARPTAGKLGAGPARDAISPCQQQRCGKGRPLLARRG